MDEFANFRRWEGKRRDEFYLNRLSIKGGVNIYFTYFSAVAAALTAFARRAFGNSSIRN